MGDTARERAAAKKDVAQEGLRDLDFFVGRTEELARLSRAFADSRAGALGIAVLVGEAGVGKTRTVREFTAQAEAEGARVLWGHCYEGEETPPYGPWTAMVRSHARRVGSAVLRTQMEAGAAEIAEVLPELREALGDPAPALRLSPLEAQIRLFDAFIGFFLAVSERSPVVVVMDNLQWADRSSLRLLEHLVSEVTEARMLIVAAYRDESSRGHLPATMGELVKHRFFRRIRLRGLSRREVGRYLAQALGVDSASAFAEEVYHRTDGNPLFVVEIARDMSCEDSTQDALRVVPQGVTEAIRRRLSRLPEGCAATLATASIIGRTFGLALLARVTGQPGSALLRSVEHALGVGLIQEMEGDADRFCFAHVLIQEALLAEISSARVARYHARIAVALEELSNGESSAELVRHLSQAGDPVSMGKLARHALLAAEAALSRHAPEEAVAVLDVALGYAEIRGADSQETAALLACRGSAGAEMGQIDVADDLVHAFDIYAAAGDVEGAVRTALTPTVRRLSFGAFETVLRSYFRGRSDLTQRALSMVAPGSLEQAKLLAQSPALSSSEEILSVAREHGDRQLESSVLARRALIELSRGEFEARSRVAEQALAIAEEVGEASIASHVLYWDRYVLSITGKAEGAAVSADRMVAIAQEARSRWLLQRAHRCRAINAFEKGEWELSRNEARNSLSLQLSRGSDFDRQACLALLAITELQTEDTKAAHTCLAEVGRGSGTPGAPLPFLAPKIAWISGDQTGFDAAVATIEQIDTPDKSPFSWWRLASRVALALAAVVKCEEKEAERWLDTLQRYRGMYLPGGPSSVSVDRLMGLLCMTARRQLQETSGHFEEALAFCRCAGYRPELAWTCYDYGRTLVRYGDHQSRRYARDVLTEGHALAKEMGMSPLRLKIEDQLRPLTRPVAGHVIHPCGLTERQVEVLRLAARGFTNGEIGERLFISPETVARHMHNILEKTGMSNRTEATAFAMREGLVD